MTDSLLVGSIFIGGPSFSYTLSSGLTLRPILGSCPSLLSYLAADVGCVRRRDGSLPI
jgi:hypothetical protein